MPQSTVNSPKINCLQLKMPQEEYVMLQPIDEEDAKSTIDKKMPKSTDNKESTVYKMLLPTVNRSTCSNLQMIIKGNRSTCYSLRMQRVQQYAIDAVYR